MALLGSSREPVPADGWTRPRPTTPQPQRLCPRLPFRLVQEVTGAAPAPDPITFAGRTGQGNPVLHRTNFCVLQPEQGHLLPTPQGLRLTGAEMGLPTDVRLS
ncbi:MAG: hypothetical protein IPL78_06360 [Chloroflexi bacterium]|nr:hypothetical protein [Chloroflexota bacterium]